jgi:hypothetical protein
MHWIRKKTKGNNSAILKMEYWLLYIALPLIALDVELISNYWFSSYAPDKKKDQRAITLQTMKTKLWLLYTALPLIALDHCMKLH